MKLQGKVKSISAKQVTKGIQVYWISAVNNYFGKVSDLHPNNNQYALVDCLSTNGCVTISISELKTLVVEYEEKIIGAELVDYDGRFTGEYQTSFNTKQLPLKYSQWQSAIDNSEVDSDKIVEFEVKEIEYKTPAGTTFDIGAKYAKIIPQKKRIKVSDINHLLFIYARMKNVHDEDVNYDYMLKFKEVIDKLEHQLNLK